MFPPGRIVEGECREEAGVNNDGWSNTSRRDP
jgi:hypothetical protein